MLCKVTHCTGHASANTSCARYYSEIQITIIMYFLFSRENRCKRCMNECRMDYRRKKWILTGRQYFLHLETLDLVSHGKIQPWLARFIDQIWKERFDPLSNILHMHACRWGWSPRRDFSSDQLHWKVEGPWYLSWGTPKWPRHHPIRQPPLFQQLPKGIALTVAATELQCMYHWCILIPLCLLNLHLCIMSTSLVTIQDQVL